MKKNAIICSLVCTTAFLFTTCFSPYSGPEQNGTATITINLGGGNSRSTVGFPGDERPWNDLEYTVTFTNISTGQVINAEVTHGPESTSASATVTFGAWRISVRAVLLVSPYGIYALAVQTFHIQAGMTIPIQMKRPVTVIFESNGGSTVSYQIVPDGGTVERPPNPSRTGFNFTDWYADSNFGNKWNFATDTVSYPGQQHLLFHVGREGKSR